MTQINRHVASRPRYLITFLIALLMGGFLMGAGASSTSDDDASQTASPDTDNPAEKIARDLTRAIEKIAEDAKEEEPFTDSPEPGYEPGYNDTDSIDNDTALSELIVPMPTPNPKGGQGQRVLIIEIRETIDMGLSAFVSRSLKSNPGIKAVIFDINTPGGRVDAATNIRDTIMELPKTVRSVAFIHPRAISAGAFISFACDYIFIADGGSIGAATPITLDGGDANPVGEKYVSYFRAEMASTARAKGRNGQIAAAMVDADVEIKGITPKGKLLTLDTAGALRHKVANGRANSIQEVKNKIALPRARHAKVAMNWAEKLARILTDPMLSGILMTLGMLGIFIELYHPGFGLPGVVGITCLVIFFAGHMVVHMAGFEEVILFVIGVVLLAVEIFVLPGFGIAGVLGILSIISALVLSLTSLPLDVSWQTGMLGAALSRVMISVLITIGLMIVAFLTLPKTRFVKNRLVLETANVATARGGIEGEVIEKKLKIGAVGKAESYLRPAGIANFDGNRVDVTSEGDFIPAGAPLEVLRIEGNHVTVRMKEDA
ncbi:MAG: nodulation protein NfeD [Deltaproteobacteria bacterium]|nr:nodulation protein NfeD [Deltaproteobacteria bacterium]